MYTSYFNNNNTSLSLISILNRMLIFRFCSTGSHYSEVHKTKGRFAATLLPRWIVKQSAVTPKSIVS